MELSIILKTSVYRGERSDPVTIVHPFIEGETVKQLANRLFVMERETNYEGAVLDVIEIRLIATPRNQCGVVE